MVLLKNVKFYLDAGKKNNFVELYKIIM